MKNIVDTLTWTKGKHTITTGINFRVMTNNKFTYSQSYPSYGFNDNVAVGLGEDIQTDLTNYMAAKTGNANFALNDPYNDASALGILLGLVNNTQVTYQVGKGGTLLPQGAPDAREFSMREYEGFVSDQWRATRELTLTFGLRYTNDPPPYEANGLQVAPNIGLDQYFAQRDYLGSQGVPSNAMPNAILSYNLNGPVNGKSSWYNPDDNNFGPRFALAYSPKDRGGLLQKIFGNGGVLRAGGAMLYDRFGSELITEFDQFGSFGLATTLNNPVSYTFSTSPRYNGTVPALPAAPTTGFPYTPPDVNGIVGEFQGIYPNLKSPYSILLNASFARELPGKLTLEVSYAGQAFPQAAAAGRRVHAARKSQGHGIRPDLAQQHDGHPQYVQQHLCVAREQHAKLRSRHRGAGGDEQSFPGAEQSVHPKYVRPGCERLLPGQRFRQLLLWHLWCLRWQLSGHAALGGPDSGAILPRPAPAHPSSAATRSSRRRAAPCPPG